MRSATARALAPVVRDHPVVTRADLDDADLNPDLAGRLVQRGLWQRLASGIYLPSSSPAAEDDLVAAAKAHVGKTFIVTGSIPLHALGLRWVPNHRGIHVLVPRGNQTQSSGCIHVTGVTGFDEIQTWVRHGVRYADPARAVIDTARRTDSLRDVGGVVLGAVADNWASPAELRLILESGQRNGSARTRRAILDAERGCASPPEAELVDALIGCRLPFYVNPEPWLDGVLLGSTDVWLVGLGIGGEVESVERHESDDDQTDSTYDRHERITTPGIELVHLSVKRVRRDVLEASGPLLARARPRADLPAATREPAGLVVVPRGPLLR